MMHMSYWFDTSVGDLLIRGFTITSIGGFIVTCMGLASLAILFEALKVYQAYIRQKTAMNNGHCHSNQCSEKESLITPQPAAETHHNRWPLVVRETGLFTVQIILSYIIMLCVMTYNGYFTITLSLASGFGYLIFGPVLLQLGMNNGGFTRPKQECQTCLEILRSRENVPAAQPNTNTLPELAEGMVHCAVPPPAEPSPTVLEQSHCCQKSVAQVHNVDV